MFTVSGVNAGDYHVMVSYQWSSRVYVARLCDRLQAAGCNVWLDLEHKGKRLRFLCFYAANFATIFFEQNFKHCKVKECRKLQTVSHLKMLQIKSAANMPFLLSYFLSYFLTFEVPFPPPPTFSHSCEEMAVSLGERLYVNS